ncbi:MAG: sugar phosphate isomerase/epimerase [Planctomycetota bacterium]
MKFAFSTIACPDWTLDRVAALAQSAGYTGVELRSMGYAGSGLACEPALTSPSKLQSILRGAGAQPCCLSTSCRFDAPIEPPIIGWAISDHNRSAREAKGMVELAADLGCPMIRVFGFEFTSRERKVSAIDRIVSRLLQVADAGRARQVRVAVENGGSFASAAALAELLDAADHPSLGAVYNTATAHSAGDTLSSGLNVLSDRLLMLKLKDLKDGKPCVLGEGQVPCQAALSSASAAGYDAWVSHEFDRAWFKDMPDPATALTTAAERMYQWAARPKTAGTGRIATTAH